MVPPKVSRIRFLLLLAVFSELATAALPGSAAQGQQGHTCGPNPLRHFTYSLCRTQIIYYVAPPGNSTIEAELHQSELLQKGQVTVVDQSNGRAKAMAGPEAEGEADSCILDSGLNISATAAAVDIAPNSDPVWYEIAKRRAARVPYDSLIVLAYGDLKTTLNTMSMCLGTFRRCSTVWVLKADGPIDPVRLQELVDSLPHKLKLMDNVYVVADSGSNNISVIYEIYGLKGVAIVRRVHMPPEEWNIFGRSERAALISGALMRRRDFNSSVLDVAHVQRPSVCTRNGEETLTVAKAQSPDHLTYDIFAFMQDFLHFDAQFYNTSTWIYHGANAEDYSMTDLMNAGTVDFGLSPVGMYAIANFSYPFPTRVYQEVYIYYHASEQSTNLNLYREILSVNTMLCLLALVLVVFLFSKLFFSGARMEELFMWCGSVFTQQGIEAETQPKTKYETASRAYFLAVAFGCILFYTILSAFLLAKFSSVTGISGLADLVARGYKFGTEEEGPIDNGFKYNYYKPASPLWPIRKSLSTRYKEEPTGITDVINKPQFAYATLQNSFISFSSKLNGTFNNPNCAKLRYMILVGDRRWGSALLKVGSELTNHFNYARLLMTQTGLTSRTLRSVLRAEAETKPTCRISSPEDEAVRNSNRGLYLQELLLVFYILGAGVAVSVVLLTAEFWRSVCKSRVGARARQNWGLSREGNEYWLQ